KHALQKSGGAAYDDEDDDEDNLTRAKTGRGRLDDDGRKRTWRIRRLDEDGHDAAAFRRRRERIRGCSEPAPDLAHCNGVREGCGERARVLCDPGINEELNK
ncbi:Protein of unknown function, partial [Gryllus bimaculatus]